ncbi:MAG: hypothetical protein HWD59_03300 [Coxiellaceae bacterium]|nr:MAG: hypothetical protein HWD59_03300 [Coxiellaceae bacterium]
MNNEQIIALKTLYRYGLRSGDLRQLSSSIFNSEHTEMLNDLILSQGLTAKEAMAEIVNTSMVFPFIFKIPENVLLKYLTNQHNLSEQDALNEINGLNSAERSILMALYKNGLRKTHLKSPIFYMENSLL